MSLITTMFESFATIKRATVGQDPSMGQTQNFNKIVATNVPCSAQQASARVQQAYAQRNIDVDTTIFFAQPPLCDINDVISVTNARTGLTLNYKVMGRAQPTGRITVYNVDALFMSQPGTVGVNA